MIIRNLRSPAAVALLLFSMLSMAAITTTISTATGRNVLGVAQAHACSWRELGYRATTVSDYRQELAVTSLYAWTNDCGSMQYNAEVWSPTGSPLTNVSVGMRIWRCGSYWGAVYSATSSWTVTVSGYGSTCGPQVNNAAGTHVTFVYTSVGYSSPQDPQFYLHIG